MDDRFQPLRVGAVYGQTPRYAAAAEAAKQVGKDTTAAINAAIVCTDWIEQQLPAARIGLICADGGHPREMVRAAADRVYRRGRAVGIIPTWLFGGWWWLRLILVLVQHWFAMQGQWSE